MFVKVQLYLSFYIVSPTAFFAKHNRNAYQSSGLLLSHRRYADGLQALGKLSHTYSDLYGNWNPPMNHDRALAEVMEHVRRKCSDICFVPRTTIPSLDDDLLRLRSTRASQFGLQHTNNPKKGLGVVHHGMVSICTGLYLGGHIASRGESNQDCVQILLRSLSGA